MSSKMVVAYIDIGGTVRPKPDSLLHGELDAVRHVVAYSLVS